MERRTLDEPLSLRLLDNGRTVHCLFFDDSALDYREAPLVFENRPSAGNWWPPPVARWRPDWLGFASPGLFITCEGAAPDTLAQDTEHGRWVEIHSDLSLAKGPTTTRSS